MQEIACPSCMPTFYATRSDGLVILCTSHLKFFASSLDVWQSILDLHTGFQAPRIFPPSTSSVSCSFAEFATPSPLAPKFNGAAEPKHRAGFENCRFLAVHSNGLNTPRSAHFALFAAHEHMSSVETLICSICSMVDGRLGNAKVCE